MLICPSQIRGEIRAIPSKSYAHRELICAALADAPTELICPSVSDDIKATADCLAALGAGVSRTRDGFRITPIDRLNRESDREIVCDCGESGSTLRFLLPVAAALGMPCRFEGRGRLPERPLSGLIGALERRGANFSRITDSTLPLRLRGRLDGDKMSVDASVSSQYISGLLLALAARGGGILSTEGATVSGGYIDVTRSVLSRFGVKTEKRENSYTVGGSLISPGSVTTEGDWSNAAFFAVAGLMRGEVRITGLDKRSAQGDRAVMKILRDMGGEIFFENGALVCKKSRLHGIELNAADIPDLVPALAIAAAGAEGETVIRGVARLRDKESDRLGAVIEILRRLNIAARSDGDVLCIEGGIMNSACLPSFGDHRMVMAAAIAGTSAGVEIDDPSPVAKSYPGFFSDLQSIGGIINENLR